MTPRLADRPSGFTTAGYAGAVAAAPGPITTKSGWRTPGAPARATRIAALSRVAGDRVGRVVWEPDPLAASDATSTPWSSTATTASISRRSCRSSDDAAPAAGVLHVHHDRPVPHRVGQRLLPIRPDDDPAPIVAAADEIGRPVREARDKEEYAGHPRIMVGMELDPVLLRHR